MMNYPGFSLKLLRSRYPKIATVARLVIFSLNAFLPLSVFSSLREIFPLVSRWFSSALVHMQEVLFGGLRVCGGWGAGYCFCIQRHKITQQTGYIMATAMTAWYKAVIWRKPVAVREYVSIWSLEDGIDLSVWIVRYLTSPLFHSRSQEVY